MRDVNRNEDVNVTGGKSRLDPDPRTLMEEDNTFLLQGVRCAVIRRPQAPMKL